MTVIFELFEDTPLDSKLLMGWDNSIITDWEDYIRSLDSNIINVEWHRQFDKTEIEFNDETEITLFLLRYT